MSGGVDSSVAAALLKRQGYEVIGVFCKFWSPPAKSNCKKFENVCCNQESLLRARNVAQKLKIPFYVLDLSREFKKEVVDYFIEEYEAGRTPNPCVVCNQKIKFGRLFEKAKQLGADYLATGHYAQIIARDAQEKPHSISPARKSVLSARLAPDHAARLRDIFHRAPLADNKINQSPVACRLLLIPKDKEKDQTYFLWALKPEQLPKIIFPVGEYTKKQVREMAKEWGLTSAGTRDSQAVCFIPDRDVVGFLKNHIKKNIKRGDIVDKKGSKLGKHEGLPFYTIGQRTRLGINPDMPDFPPQYVVAKDATKNQIIIGGEKDLYKQELIVGNINWFDSNLPIYQFTNLLTAKIRYGQDPQKCMVKKTKSGLLVKFEKPQRAITPGQSIVFYHKGQLLGGGIIAKFKV